MEFGIDYYDKFPIKEELAYNGYLVHDPHPNYYRRLPIIGRGDPSNISIPCNKGHVHVWKAYIDLTFPANIMTSVHYNWIMKKQLVHRRDPKDSRKISNFTGRFKGIHVFVGNFAYLTDFLVVEDISSAIDPCLSHVVLEKPFVEVSNMTYDPSLGIVKFIDENC